MSNRTKVRRYEVQTADSRPSKRERRELGRKAAIARARARRRRIWLKNGGTVAAALAVVAVIVLSFTIFKSNPTAGPEDLSAKPEVSAGDGTLTALKVTTRVEGGGSPVKKGQTLTVQYVGVNYATGEQFDASWDKGQPFSFVLGNSEVIKGWDQGLVGVKVGSRVQLDIPQALAYPTETSGPTAGALRFVIDIISATDASATPSGSASPSASPTPTVTPAA